MGNCLLRLINVYLGKRVIKKHIILFITGLDNAGKTSVLNCISNDIDDSVMPTMGFRVVSLKHRFHSIKAYDVGGGPQIRSIWKRYYKDIHGVIYVVDASDASRLNENKVVFGELVSHEHIAGKPILLLANKQDIPGAIDELDLVENLEIESVVNLQRCPTRVETCSCALGQKYFKENTRGVIDGYRWLLETIVKNYSTLEEQINSSQSVVVPVPVNNHSENRRSSQMSISSISQTHIPMNSNPFKPINELVNATRKDLNNQNNHVKTKKEPIKKFLSRNKTAPTPDNPPIPINDTEIEYLNETEHNGQVAFVTLDPLNLLSHRNCISNTNEQKQMTRPFTAPQLQQKRDKFTMVNIPGQVPPS